MSEKKKNISKRTQEGLNEMRMLAHEAIADLFQHRQKSHLRLLLNHCKSSLIALGEQEEEEKQ